MSGPGGRSFQLSRSAGGAAYAFGSMTVDSTVDSGDGGFFHLKISLDRTHQILDFPHLFSKARY